MLRKVWKGVVEVWVGQTCCEGGGQDEENGEVVMGGEGGVDGVWRVWKLGYDCCGGWRIWKG